MKRAKIKTVNYDSIFQVFFFIIVSCQIRWNNESIKYTLIYVFKINLNMSSIGQLKSGLKYIFVQDS